MVERLFWRNLLKRKESDRTLEELHVKNYGEYLRRLKEDFSGAKQMPSADEVRSFISRYNLYSDWKIVITDVRQDIFLQILNSKTIADKQKRISSYKEYLIKLKAAFGIPKVMPEDSEIEDFISEFGLEKNWGITVKEVSEDLEKFISGKYDELYKDAIHKPKHSVHTPVQQSYTYVPSVRKPLPISRQVCHAILTSISSGCCVSQNASQKLVRTKNPLQNNPTSKPAKQKHSWKKKESKLQETIFIDGDNHFDEGQKGIECTTKDTKVRVIFSQPGAKRRFDRKYGRRPNVSSKLVSPGNQAVDNQIKAEAGQLLKKRNQDVTIVSQDTGFAKYRDRKKNNKLGNKISTAKSVREKLIKNKNKDKI